MIDSPLVTFAGGVLVGLLFAWVLRMFFRPKRGFLPPTIISVVCQPAGSITINGTNGTPPDGTTIVHLHVKVSEDANHLFLASPFDEGGATQYGPSFPIVHPLGGLTGSVVAVWEEYQGFTKDEHAFSCSGSGLGSGSGSVSGSGATNFSPDDTVPASLTATVALGGAWFNDHPSFLLTPDFTGTIWRHVTKSVFGTCDPAGVDVVRFQLECNTDVWELDVNTNGARTYSPPASVSCRDPFEIVFTGVDLAGCGGAAGATVTITAS